MSLSFTSLLVGDPVALAACYHDVFDLPGVPSLNSEHFRGLLVGGTVLGFSAGSAYDLLELPRPDPQDRGVRSFLTFEADDPADVDRLTLRAQGCGGTVRKQPSRTYYGAYQLFVLDPEGHAFRINHLLIDEVADGSG